MLEVAFKRSVGAFTLDVALEVGAGTTAIFGPSGAGKTTLARCVAGLARPDHGRIALDGRVLFGGGTAVPPHRRDIGYVFQEARLFPHMNVRRNLLYGAPRGTDPGPVCEMLGIGGLLARRTAGLSGGEAARVAIGRALLRRPRLLILDEPLAALDGPRRDRVLPWLERVRDAGVPILYISHAVEEVARLADTLVLLRDGRVARAGPVGDMLSDPSVAALMGSMQAGAVLSGRMVAERDGIAAVETPVGTLQVVGAGEIGARIRIRIRAEDVIVATEPPREVSALNVLAGTVASIQPGHGPGVMLRLAIGEGHLLARVTRRSATALDLVEGRAIWALVKATGVARADIG
ncbi:molybdenum ABC transporter ATP-binding protein [uncultured Jannaschia sp.]|uniref:molybdenum ABC transporter ATP-binding protein n=1 Tax=uncultured Jannaschia sp. TaxID=293347 RepID=UPI00262196F5|nr:molybdenum ABC transporter ATP-binding protein [uncultured Jannaschia sp.]